MDNLLQIINAPSIDGETQAEREQRLAIPDNLSKGDMIGKLIEIYKQNSRLAGDFTSIENNLAKALNPINEQKANKVDNFNKVESPNRDSGVSKMADTNQNPFGVPAGNQNVTKEAVKGFDGGNVQPATAAKVNDGPSESVIQKLTEAGLTEAQVREFMEKKTSAGVDLASSQKQIAGVAATALYSLKPSVAARVKSIPTVHIYGKNGTHMEGIEACFVKPTRGVVNPKNIEKKSRELMAKLVAMTGYDETTGEVDTAKCGDNADVTSIAYVYGLLKNATRISDNEADPAMLASIPGLPQNVLETFKAGDGAKSLEVLNNRKLIVPHGNVTFLGNKNGLREAAPVKGIALSNSELKYKGGDIVPMSMVGEYFGSRQIPAFKGPGNAQIVIRQVKNKADGSISFVASAKNYSATTIANTVAAGNDGYIAINAVLPEIKGAGVKKIKGAKDQDPTFEVQKKSDGTMKSSKFSFKVYVKVPNGFKTIANMPDFLTVKVKESKGSGQGRVTQNYLDTIANLQNGTASFDESANFMLNQLKLSNAARTVGGAQSADSIEKRLQAKLAAAAENRKKAAAAKKTKV